MGFLLLALASWRIAVMLTQDLGPGAIFARLRAYALKLALSKKMGWVAVGLNCPSCAGVWIAAAMLLLPECQGKELFIRWLALAGAITLIARGVDALSQGTGSPFTPMGSQWDIQPAPKIREVPVNFPKRDATSAASSATPGCGCSG